MGTATRNFDWAEFDCHCCAGSGRSKMQEHIIDMLQDARDIAGIPFVVASGYRCKNHNQRVGGKPSSSHLKGKAADLLVKSSAERFKIINGLIRAGFVRIGVGADFIHCDISTDKTQRLIWLYK